MAEITYHRGVSLPACGETVKAFAQRQMPGDLGNVGKPYPRRAAGILQAGKLSPGSFPKEENPAGPVR